MVPGDSQRGGHPQLAPAAATPPSTSDRDSPRGMVVPDAGGIGRSTSRCREARQRRMPVLGNRTHPRNLHFAGRRAKDALAEVLCTLAHRRSRCELGTQSWVFRDMTACATSALLGQVNTAKGRKITRRLARNDSIQLGGMLLLRLQGRIKRPITGPVPPQPHYEDICVIGQIPSKEAWILGIEPQDQNRTRRVGFSALEWARRCRVSSAFSSGGVGIEINARSSGTLPRGTVHRCWRSRPERSDG